MPSNHEPRELGTGLQASGQSPMLSAAAAMPFRPYIWHGDDSPVIGSPAELETRGLVDAKREHAMICSFCSLPICPGDACQEDNSGDIVMHAGCAEDADDEFGEFG